MVDRYDWSFGVGGCGLGWDLGGCGGGRDGGDGM